MHAPKSKFRREILPHVFTTGATYQTTLATEEVSALETFLGFSCPTNRFWAFNRLELSSTSSTICGLEYKRMFKRNCAVVRYSSNNSWAFGMVRFFVTCNFPQTSDSPHAYLVIAHPFFCGSYNLKLHINRVTPCDRDKVVVFSVTDIYTNSIYIEFSSGMAYVCEFPNKRD